MGDTGNAFPLLGRGGGHQRAGANEKNLVELTGTHLLQNGGAEDRCAAPAPGAARVDVLLFAVVDHQSAVVVHRADVYPSRLIRSSSRSLPTRPRSPVRIRS